MFLTFFFIDGYVDGMGLYANYFGLNGVDPLGLEDCCLDEWRVWRDFNNSVSSLTGLIDLYNSLAIGASGFSPTLNKMVADSNKLMVETLKSHAKATIKYLDCLKESTAREREWLSTLEKVEVGSYIAIGAGIGSIAFLSGGGYLLLAMESGAFQLGTSMVALKVTTTVTGVSIAGAGITGMGVGLTEELGGFPVTPEGAPGLPWLGPLHQGAFDMGEQLVHWSFEAGMYEKPCCKEEGK